MDDSGSLHQLAELGEASALVAAAVALIGLWLTIKEGQVRNRQDEILKWQKLVVYELIRNGTVSFDDIKIRYVVEAQQYGDVPIPRKEITDSSLKLVLLSLIELHLISLTLAGTYAINVVDPSERARMASIYDQFIRRGQHQKIISDLLQLLDRESGKFTIDQAYRHLKVEEAGYQFEEFDVMVREYASRGFLVFARDDKLWLRSRLPPSSTRPQSSAGTQAGTPPQNA